MPVKEPPDLSRFLLSPMPGLLMALKVAEGQPVKAGEELAVVEAMKMENVLRAGRDGKVAKIHAGPGESLAVDQAILERSEEHTSELQSLMRISYAVFCLKKKNKEKNQTDNQPNI